MYNLTTKTLSDFQAYPVGRAGETAWTEKDSDCTLAYGGTLVSEQFLFLRELSMLATLASDLREVVEGKFRELAERVDGFMGSQEAISLQVIFSVDSLGSIKILTGDWWTVVWGCGNHLSRFWSDLQGRPDP